MERIFLRLGDNGALGSDGLQWILYRPRRHGRPDGERIGSWTPVAFVRSSKAILDRCILEAGITLSADGARALTMLPASFDAFQKAISGRPDGHLASPGTPTARRRSRGRAPRRSRDGVT